MKYSILINTCDKFEDCWNPFFKLWSLYWKDCNGKIYLNTEYKDYSYPGINIIPVKGCANHNISKNQRATWSQCLKWALESMDSDIVLYMQEDYFLKDTVKNDIVEQYVVLMEKHPDIKCIHLTDQSVATDQDTPYPHLKRVIPKQRYRMSCQAALWRKQELLDVLREKESAWEFEEFGSQRSGVMNHTYLCIDRNYVKLNIFEIIPYIFTGIVQGRWYDPVVDLFKKHQIEIDYSIRGFVSNRKKKPFKKRVEYRLKKIPKIIKNRIELYKIKQNLNSK